MEVFHRFLCIEKKEPAMRVKQVYACAWRLKRLILMCMYLYVSTCACCMYSHLHIWLSSTCTVYVCLLCIHACVCSVRVSEGTFGYVKVCLWSHVEKYGYNQLQLWEQIAHDIKITEHTSAISIFLSSIPSLIQGKNTHTHANIMQYGCVWK
jgi:hypothetical protein